MNRLAQLFVEICENNRDRRDYTRAEIRRAIREVAASFSVYRTYVAPERDEIAEEDVKQISNAVAFAKTQRSDLSPDLFDFIGDVLTLRARGAIETEFLLRFQQFTSAVMAKGVEDTAFYCYNRMIGLNEVGGAPERNGTTLDEFHSHCARDASRPSANDEYSFNTRYEEIGRCARTISRTDGNPRAAGARRCIAGRAGTSSSRPISFRITTRNTFSIRR